tara:strand:+ start:259 stop:678 length:420 start_codon:yes stop_codon:yes gene_type:complete
MAVLTHVNNDVVRIKNDVDAVSAAVTLTSADSGKWYELTSTTGVTVTLPAVESGLHFRFVVANAFDTSNYIIDSAEGDNIDGILVVNGASVAASGEDQINFVASAESVGDFIDIWSDGSKWYVWGIGNASGSITATDPS